MSLHIKFLIGLTIGCTGFLFTFIICAVLSCPTNIMILPIGSFLIIIVSCFIVFYVSYNNLTFKFTPLYNKNKLHSTSIFIKLGF